MAKFSAKVAHFKKCFNLNTKYTVRTGEKLVRFTLPWPGEVHMHMPLMRYAKCTCGAVTNGPFLFFSQSWTKKKI